MSVGELMQFHFTFGNPEGWLLTVLSTGYAAFGAADRQGQLSMGGKAVTATVSGFTPTSDRLIFPATS